MADACDGCGSGFHITSNRLPDGQSLDLCPSCVRGAMRMWQAWRRADPEEADRIARAGRVLA